MCIGIRYYIIICTQYFYDFEFCKFAFFHVHCYMSMYYKNLSHCYIFSINHQCIEFECAL